MTTTTIRPSISMLRMKNDKISMKHAVVDVFHAGKIEIEPTQVAAAEANMLENDKKCKKF